MNKPKKRGRGRPRIPHPRCERVELRLTPKEKRIWTRAAEKRAKDLATFIRKCVTASIARTKRG